MKKKTSPLQKLMKMILSIIHYFSKEKILIQVSQHYIYMYNVVNVIINILALTKAGHHMEDCIVSSYSAMILAILAKNNSVCKRVCFLILFFFF